MADDEETTDSPGFLDEGFLGGASVEDAHTEPPKKRVGRPPGRKNKKTDSQPDPSKSEAKTGKRGPGRPPKSSAGPLPSLREQIESTLKLGASIWEMGDPYCGQVAQQQVEPMAAALDSWAQSSPGLHNALSGTMRGSGPIGFLMASLPLCVAVATHHNPRAVAFRKAQAEAEAQMEAEAAMHPEGEPNWSEPNPFVDLSSNHEPDPGYVPTY